jgi:hypothetical protein
MNRRESILSLVAAAAGGAALLVPCRAHCCVVTFEPREVLAGADGQATFIARIQLDHTRCILDLPPRCIELRPSGLGILSETGWKKVRRSLFENRYHVALAGERGSLRIWRECSKKGISEGEITVRRVPA